MSNFTTPAEELTFADLDAFLLRNRKEGLMLDYKADRFPWRRRCSRHRHS
jgi:hypothetical protein